MNKNNIKNKFPSVYIFLYKIYEFIKRIWLISNDFSRKSYSQFGEDLVLQRFCIEIDKIKMDFMLMLVLTNQMNFLIPIYFIKKDGVELTWMQTWKHEIV
jgi:hypothetical protein